MGHSTTPEALDLDGFAYDIADLIDKYRYPIPGHIGADEIRAALPAFLTALGLDAAGRPLNAGDAPPATPTKHTCCRPGRGPGFRRTPGCPRCDELTAGAAPRPAHAGIDAIRRAADTDADRVREIRDHFAPGGPHDRGECGPVCTAHDW